MAYYFYLKGLRTRRRLDFVWAGLALGLGLHTYAPFRAIPFVLIVFFIFLIADAALRRRNFLREFGVPLVVAVFAACLVFAPLGQYALRHRRAFMDRTQAASIFTKRDQADIVQALRSNTRLHLLMFNLRGDKNGRHNLPNAPMLDFASGVLFVIGLGYALYRWREPPFFLFLVSFCALLMGGILSVDFEAPQALRSFGVLPAVYVFMSAVLERLWAAFRRGFGEKWRGVFLGGVAILAGVGRRLRDRTPFRTRRRLLHHPRHRAKEEDVAGLDGTGAQLGQPVAGPGLPEEVDGLHGPARGEVGLGSLQRLGFAQVLLDQVSPSERIGDLGFGHPSPPGCGEGETSAALGG